MASRRCLGSHRVISATRNRQHTDIDLPLAELGAGGSALNGGFAFSRDFSPNRPLPSSLTYTLPYSVLSQLVLYEERAMGMYVEGSGAVLSV